MERRRADVTLHERGIAGQVDMQTSQETPASTGDQFETLAAKLIALLSGWGASGPKAYADRGIGPVLNVETYRVTCRLNDVQCELEHFSRESRHVSSQPFETVAKEIVAQFLFFAKLDKFEPVTDATILSLQLRQIFGGVDQPIGTDSI